MRIDIVTLFPEMCENILNESIIGRARARGYLQVCCHQLRDHGEGVHKRVDDCTFGGGKGMLLMAQPIAKAFDEIIEQTAVRPHIVYMSPRGRVLDQEKTRISSCFAGIMRVWMSAFWRNTTWRKSPSAILS